MSLQTNLISYWKFDEASGNALDARGSESLTQNGTVGSAAGIISTSREFTTFNFFSHADDDALSTGDIDFTWQVWLYPNSLTLPDGAGAIFQKSETDRYEYALYILPSGKMRFDVSSAATGFGSITSITSTAALTVGSWFHVVCWHDAGGNQLGITINNGTPDTLSYSAGVADTTASFRCGASPFNEYYPGRIDESAFWKRILTAGEITSLYNGGAGLVYPFDRNNLYIGAVQPGGLWIGAVQPAAPPPAGGSKPIAAWARQRSRRMTPVGGVR